jgi:hypothetical protein
MASMSAEKTRAWLAERVAASLQAALADLASRLDAERIRRSLERAGVSLARRSRS